MTRRHWSDWTVPLLVLGIAACGGGTVLEETVDDGSSGERFTLWEEGLEVFYEHPILIAGAREQAWAVHVTDLEDFTAVTDGQLRMLLEGPDGTLETTVSPTSPGIFTPAPVLPAGGTYDLIFILERGARRQEVYVGPVIVHASIEDVPDLPPLESVGIQFVKEQQWAIDFATVEAEQRTIVRSMAASGHIEAPPDGRAEVVAPAEGLLLVPTNARAPVEGQAVRRGDALAVLSPTGREDGYALLVARVQRLAREVERAERLYAQEAIPRRQLDDARHDLEVAEAALTAMGGNASDDYALTLRAPLSGVVHQRMLVPGALVHAGDVLYTLVDPRRVWVRMDVPARWAEVVGQVSGATFRVEGGDTVYRTDRVVAVGSVVDPTHRTIPVTLAFDNETAGLPVGLLAEGRVLLGGGEAGVAVPADAIRDEDGLMVVYVQMSGESFERRAVVVGSTDGEWTLLRSGVRPGERVVIRGAYQVRLSSLNTNEISDHGHPH
jgi:RND family efflux transporter MFP subunit